MNIVFIYAFNLLIRVGNPTMKVLNWPKLNHSHYRKKARATASSFLCIFS